MLTSSFPPWPSFTREEQEAVARVLASNRVNYWTGGECQAFEREFAAFVGASQAVSLSNGTVALELALEALEIGPGDEVVVTPRTFLASASCIVRRGAVPVFADIDRETQNITAETVARVIGPQTKAIICVHLAGMPCDLDPILDLARSHGLAVLEDCAQAHGARYKGRSVGTLGNVAAWSFCQDKIMTTGGEGGMVTSNDAVVATRVWALKDHGKNAALATMWANTARFRWLHESFGTNGRMIEMQAAIGRIQLGRMPTWSARRRDNAEAIWQAARQLPGLRAPMVPAWAEHAAYRAYVFVEPAALAGGWSRERIIEEIAARDVPCFVGTCPEVYLERAFDGTGWRPKERLPVACELGETSLCFLVHPTLGDAEIGRTCEALAEVMNMAVR